MSSLFGQVWLWSLLSFVAGVALTWLVLVRPAKRELEDLEERLLTSPRPASSPTSSSVAGGSAGPTSAPRDEFDNWHVEASRSLADDVLSPEPTRYDAGERTRYEAREPSRYDSAVEAPHYDVANMKLDQRDSLLEELDDEHRPLSDFEEQHDFPEYEPEPPRSLFERLAPEGGGQDTRHDTRHDTRETLEPRSRQYGPDDEPELPAEETHLMPAVPAAAVADVAPRQQEPTAPPEVEAFQPREVWREEPVQEVYQDEVSGGHEEEDEPEHRPVPAEETALIPATALAEAIAEVDREQRRPDPEPDLEVWPEHDLTGHFSPVDVESTRHEPTHREPTEEDRDGGGFRTEVITAVVDPAPVESQPEVTRPEVERHEVMQPDVSQSEVTLPEVTRPEAVQPEPVDEPEQHRAAEPAAEPEVTAPEPAQPFEPTFVQPAERDEPEPTEPGPEPAAAEAKPEPKKDEPARPRSLFEPLPDTGDEPQPEPEQVRRPPQPIGNDQPFVPTLSPELLAGNPTPLTANGLPQRPTRPTGAPRTPSPAPLAPKPVTPPPPRPVRPRPVGFSPSTGGRPAPGSTRFQGQQEGFNPRSPFGPGSVLPKSDGLAPAPEFQVKATLTGRRYFTDESANFRETRADVWFRTTADAEKAGFRQAP